MSSKSNNSELLRCLNVSLHKSLKELHGESLPCIMSGPYLTCRSWHWHRQLRCKPLGDQFHRASGSTEFSTHQFPCRQLNEVMKLEMLSVFVGAGRCLVDLNPGAAGKSWSLLKHPAFPRGICAVCFEPLRSDEGEQVRHRWPVKVAAKGGVLLSILWDIWSRIEEQPLRICSAHTIAWSLGPQLE